MPPVARILALVCLTCPFSVLALSNENSAPLKNLPGKVKLSNPVAVSSSDKTCGGLWFKDKGTVCNKTALVSYKTQEQKVVKSSLEKLMAYMESMTNTAQNQFSNGFEDIPEITDNVNYLRLLGNTSFYNSAVANTKNCWAYMEKVRSAALCSACSAKNYKYFIGDNALVRQQDWISMESNCEKHINTTMVYLRYGITTVKIRLLRRRNMYLTLTTNPNIESQIKKEAKRLYDLAIQHQIEIQKIVDYFKEQLKNFPQKLNAAFFRLTKEPSIMIIGGLVEKSMAKLKQISIADINLQAWITSRTLRMVSNYVPKIDSRNLQQLLAQTTDLLSSGGGDSLLLTSISDQTVTADDPWTGDKKTMTNNNKEMSPVDFSLTTL